MFNWLLALLMKGFNGFWSKIPMGIWRGLLVIAIVFLAYFEWTTSCKVNADMVTKEAFAESCKQSKDRNDEILRIVEHSIEDMKKTIEKTQEAINENRKEIIKTIRETRK